MEIPRILDTDELSKKEVSINIILPLSTYNIFSTIVTSGSMHSIPDDEMYQTWIALVYFSRIIRFPIMDHYLNTLTGTTTLVLT